ncbi:MAG: hypothetical protein U9N13_07905 [Euryarchaeota archaeon]|nr:hypothetical protein [Euryarchaeota archaeon]
MADLKDDTRGQWILLSGLTIAISLVTVAVLLNQSAVTGYYSSNAALEFPKEQIRDLTMQTRETAQSATLLAYQLNQSTNQTVPTIITTLLQNYSTQTGILYASHGETVDIRVSNISMNTSNSTIVDSIWMNISYYDGNTFYSSEPEIIEVNV